MTELTASALMTKLSYLNTSLTNVQWVKEREAPSPLVSSSAERKKRGGEKVESGCEKQTTITLAALGGPREPDHVAIETQVQQKVTGKSIRIELISPALPSQPPRRHKPPAFNCCSADAAQKNATNVSFLPSFPGF